MAHNVDSAPVLVPLTLTSDHGDTKTVVVNLAYLVWMGPREPTPGYPGRSELHLTTHELWVNETVEEIQDLIAGRVPA